MVSIAGRRTVVPSIERESRWQELPEKGRRVQRGRVFKTNRKSTLYHKK